MNIWHLGIIVISVILFFFIIPIMPLIHSSPANFVSGMYQWPEFYGSVMWGLFQCGGSVGGTGIFEFNCSPMLRI